MASAPTSTPSTRRAGPTCTSTRSSAWSITTTTSAASSPCSTPSRASSAASCTPTCSGWAWRGRFTAVPVGTGGAGRAAAGIRRPHRGPGAEPGCPGEPGQPPLCLVPAGPGAARAGGRLGAGSAGRPHLSPELNEEQIKDRMEALLHRYFRRARRSVTDRQWAAWAGRDMLYGDKKRGGLVRGNALRRLGRSGGGPAEEDGRKFFWQKKHLFHLGQGADPGSRCCGTMWENCFGVSMPPPGSWPPRSRPCAPAATKLPPPTSPGVLPQGRWTGRPPGSGPPSRPSGRRTGPISKKIWCGTGSSSPSCPSGCKTPSCSRATSPTAAPGRASFSPGWPGGPRPPGPAGLSPAAAE